MADFNWTYLTELQAWNATNLNAYFQEIEDGLNDIELYAIEDLALTTWHLGSGLLTLDTASPDPSVRINTPSNSYTNNYKKWNDDTVGDPGWAVVTNGTTSATVEWSGGYSMGMANGDQVVGIMVCAEANVRWIEMTSDGTNYPAAWVALAIQWKDSGGTWHTIAKTERFIDSWYLAEERGWAGTGVLQADDVVFWALCFPFTIRTMVLPADVSGDVYGVRLVVSNYSGNTTASGGVNMNPVIGNTSAANSVEETYIGEFSITAFPVHAKDP